MAAVLESKTENSDGVAVASDVLAKLEHVRRNVFTKRKEEKAKLVQELIDKVFEALGPADEAEAALPGKQRAKRAFIRGRALDAKEEYDAAAEGYLARAVKLDPTAIDHWNGLGHVFWKKDDLEQAKQWVSKRIEFVEGRIKQVDAAVEAKREE